VGRLPTVSGAVAGGRYDGAMLRRVWIAVYCLRLWRGRRGIRRGGIGELHQGYAIGGCVRMQPDVRLPGLDAPVGSN